MSRTGWLKGVMVGGMGLLFCGCAIQQQVKPVQAIPELKTKAICLIDEPAVRQSFRDALARSLEERGYTVTVTVPGTTTPEACPMTLTYTANWLWDLRTYLAFARITVYSGGKVVGEATYDSRGGGMTLKKFVNAEEKVEELVEQLYPKQPR